MSRNGNDEINIEPSISAVKLACDLGRTYLENLPTRLASPDDIVRANLSHFDEFPSETSSDPTATLTWDQVVFNDATSPIGVKLENVAARLAGYPSTVQ